MVEPTEELPISEEPKVEAEEEPKIDPTDLLAELARAGVENPEQLQGKLDASAQAGRAFQMLGDERKRTETLQAEVDRLKAQPKEPNYDSYGEGQPIDMEAAMERSVEKIFSKREQAAQQAQQASVYAYNAITTDQNFHLVKDVWEEKIKNPAYLAQAQSGQINPIMDYQNMVVDYYKNIAKESHKTITELVGGGTGTATVPHVESGESHSPNVVSEGKGVSANRKFLDRMHVKVNTEGYVPNSDEEVLIATAQLEESLRSPEK